MDLPESQLLAPACGFSIVYKSTSEDSLGSGNRLVWLTQMRWWAPPFAPVAVTADVSGSS
jgi:hypothetical protein